MEVPQVVLWVEVTIEWKFLVSISISSLNGLNSNFSGPLKLTQNVTRVELLISWVKIIWLLVVSLLNVLNILLIESEIVKHVLSVAINKFILSIWIVTICTI